MWNSHRHASTRVRRCDQRRNDRIITERTRWNLRHDKWGGRNCSQLPALRGAAFFLNPITRLVWAKLLWARSREHYSYALERHFSVRHMECIYIQGKNKSSAVRWITHSLKIRVSQQIPFISQLMFQVIVYTSYINKYIWYTVQGNKQHYDIYTPWYLTRNSKISG